MAERNIRGILIESRYRFEENFYKFLNNLNYVDGLLYIKKQRIGTIGLTLWIFIIILNVVFSIVLLVLLKGRQGQEVIATNIDPRCSIEDVPFPNVAICNFNIVSKKSANNIVRLLREGGINQSRTEKFLSSLIYLEIPTLFNDDLDNFTKEMMIMKQNLYSIEDIMLQVRQQCKHLLQMCYVNMKIKECKNIFRMMKTKYGHCCTFDFERISKEVDRFTGDHKIEENSKYQRDVHYFRTGMSGSGTGLVLALNIEANDYPSWNHLKYNGLKVLISDPHDYPDISVREFFIQSGQLLQLSVYPKIITTNEALRSLKPQQRGCYYEDESVLLLSGTYSFETCCSECKLWFFNDSCGCSPYVYLIRANLTRYCDFPDLPCLKNYTIFGESTNPKYARDCDCLPQCNDIKYSVVPEHYPIDSYDLPNEFQSLIDAGYNNITGLVVQYTSPNCECYTRDFVMSNYEVLAYYGGLFSLTFGISIISIIQISHHLLTKIYKIIQSLLFEKRHNTKSKHHKNNKIFVVEKKIWKQTRK